MKYIDIHPHIIADDTKRYPLAPLGGHQSDWSRTRPVTTEQMIAAMDKAGVAKAAIVQASTCYGHDNSYVADAIAAHPDRFTGVFSADVLAADAPEKMRHWLSRGFAGMRLFTIGSTMPDQASWLDDPKTYPAWEAAGELGISICLQMSAQAFPQMIKMAERFPKVRILLDHMARPVLEDGQPYAAASSLFELAKIPTVYLKLTPRSFIEVAQGQGDAGDILPPAGLEVRSFAAGVGLELSFVRGLPAATAGARNQRISHAPSGRPRMDFPQDRPDALSRSCKVRIAYNGQRR